MTGTDGTVVIGSCAGLSGLPIAIVGSTDGDGSDSVGVVAVLDDRVSQVGGPTRHRQWRDWLRWSNLLQFLTLPRHGHAMPLRMAESWTVDSLDFFRNRPVPLALASPAVAVAKIDIVSPGWATVIEYTDTSLAGVGRSLAGRGVPEPEAGGEVGDGAEVWQVEYSWPRERLAVVVDVDDARDEWLARHGWRVFAHHGADQEEFVHKIEAAFEVVS